jgi:RNA polymerase sigma-70 factor (ECF subfamily)
MKNQIISFQAEIISFSKTLRPFAFSLTKDNEEAKDLIQETVFKALRYKDKFSEGTNIKAWMYTIMRNIFINNYRRKVKQNTFIDSSDNQFLINSSEVVKTARNEGENKMMMKDINAAIGGLKDEIKVPFMMHFEGFKYQEIAEELMLPLGTIKSRIFFARKELQSLLKVYSN